MKKVAIQGIEGSYHAITAKEFFPKEEVELICCSTFEDIFAFIEQNPEGIGIVAIENTIAGSLLQNHELIRKNNVKIIGEHKLRISHCIACLPEDDLTTLNEVNSHPIALMQCTQFLREHPQLKIVEVEDTALSAKLIAKKRLMGHAAICSILAAEVFGLKVLQKGIETNKQNYTRFLIIVHPDHDLAKNNHHPVDTASLVFTLPHTTGSLATILSILARHNINLTKIQSLPIIGRPWEYQFYITVSFSNRNEYQQALVEIAPQISELKIIGEYAKFKK